MKQLILRLMFFLEVQAGTTWVWRSIEAQVGAQTPAVVRAREAFPDRDLCSGRQPLGVDGSDSASRAPETTGGWSPEGPVVQAGGAPNQLVQPFRWVSSWRQPATNAL